MMKRIARAVLALSVVASAAAVSTPALADGDVKCGGGPVAKWKPLSAVKKKAWMEGWKVAKVQVEGDCFEVYGHTESGQAVEAFFHPVTLQKLLVLRRGSEVFRAPGFKG